MTDDTMITAWGAGIFEGEGSIGIIKGRVRVVVHMTDVDILEKLRDNFGGVIYDAKKQKEHHKQSWKWTITSTPACIGFLLKIKPFMGIRRSARIDEAVNAFENGKITKYTLQREQIQAFQEQGLTHKQIADKLGCSRSNVSHIIRKMRMVAVV
jgi:hypothetical protein